MMELLNNAVTIAVLSFVISSMLAMGAGLTVSQLFEPLRNVRLVVLALLANFVLMPLAPSPWERCSGSTNRLTLDCCCRLARPARHSCRSLLNSPRAVSRLR